MDTVMTSPFSISPSDLLPRLGDSQDVAEQLRALGFHAFFLAGGIQGRDDGVDSPAEIANWRTTQLPRQEK